MLPVRVQDPVRPAGLQSHHAVTNAVILSRIVATFGKKEVVWSPECVSIQIFT